MPSQNNNHNPSSSGNSRERRDRRPRRIRNNNNNDDPDAAFKDQIKAERRAQVMQNTADQEENQQERSGEEIGDNMQAANVSSVPRSSSRNGSGGSSSRSGRSRRQHTRPANKGPSKAAPSQVGAMAATGRAFGAPRRPPTAPNNMTRSIAGDGHYESSSDDEENAAAPRNTKEAVAMNTMTVEDHEREKRRRRKVQEEASRLTQEIKDESKSKKKPYEKEMAFAVAEEDSGDNDAKKAGDPSNKGRNEPDHSDEARRWKKIAMCLGCLLLAMAIGVGVFFVLQKPPASTPAATSLNYPPPSQRDCSAISSGMSVPGQDTLEQRDVLVELEVELSADSNMDLLLSELRLKIQRIFLPEIVGCDQEKDDSGNDPYRYVIANAIVDDIKESELNRSCSNTNQLCIPISVGLQIFPKGPLNDLKMNEHIASSFLIGVDLAPKLNLVSPVGRIVALDVLGKTPQTPSPTASASATPTASTTKFPTVALIYSPPRSQDCVNILNGLPVDGQDRLFKLSFSVELEVELFSDLDPDAAYLPVLKEQIEKYLIPPLAGCDAVDGGARRLNERYVIANAVVTTVTRNEGETCRPNRSQPYCHRISVGLDLLLKENMPIYTLFVYIAAVFPVGVDLREPLRLSTWPYRLVVTKEIGATDVIQVPSANDAVIQVPSANPTLAASNASTPSPTRAPTLSPTRVTSTLPNTTSPTRFP